MSAEDFGRCRRDFARLYTDRMDAWRYGRDAEGEAVVAEAAIVENVPCRVSFSARMDFAGRDNPKWGRGENGSEAVSQLYCGLEHDLHNGDYVVVRREGVVICQGNIGEPGRYGHSQQMRIWQRKRG